MGQKVSGGSDSERDVLAALSSRGNVAASVKLESSVPCPDALYHIWQWFVELNNERGSNGFGPSPITSTGIKDWCWATGRNPQKWEIAVIKQLDVLWLNNQPKDSKPSK